MTTQELLKPRYKLLIDYPGCLVEVGHVFQYTEHAQPFTVDGWCKQFDRYRDIYRKLEWWEDRKPEVMPEYVRKGDDFYRVHEWHINLAPKVTAIVNPKIHTKFAAHATEFTLYGDILPATKEEYDSSK